MSLSFGLRVTKTSGKEVADLLARQIVPPLIYLNLIFNQLLVWHNQAMGKNQERRFFWDSIEIKKQLLSQPLTVQVVSL